MTKLGKRAFGSCSKLATVNFAGLVEDWNKIYQENGNWYAGTLVTVVHCVDGDVNL